MLANAHELHPRRHAGQLKTPTPTLCPISRSKRRMALSLPLATIPRSSSSAARRVPELCENPDFATNDARVRNRETLLPTLYEIFETRASRNGFQGWNASAAGRSTISSRCLTIRMSRLAAWWSI